MIKTNSCTEGDCETCDKKHNNFSFEHDRKIIQFELEPTENGCYVYYPPQNHPKYESEGYEGWGVNPTRALLQLVNYWNENFCDFGFPFIIVEAEQ